MTWRVEKLILLFLLSLGTACTPATTEIDIPFAVLYEGQPIGCDTPVDAVSMTDLRLYIYDLRLLGPENSETPIALRPDEVWQTESVALLDFENGTGACINGSERTNTVIRGRHVPADSHGVAFRIGVPSGLNHEDALTARPPLNFTDMHWHWATGYKFLRAGIETKDDGFWIHLGSSLCEGTIGDIKGCRAPNRPEV
ncbi:MAG: MbnP family copper-binding protein, partial [Woeseiaceae bacterium]